MGGWAIGWFVSYRFFFFSSEERLLYPIQSQIICESQSISNPVFTLSCDCLANGGYFFFFDLFFFLFVFPVHRQFHSNLKQEKSVTAKESNKKKFKWVYLKFVKENQHLLRFLKLFIGRLYKLIHSDHFFFLFRTLLPK